jgi:hypothetical protein
MPIVGLFNEAGFRKADVGSRDYMVSFGISDEPKPDEAFRQGFSQTVPNPVFEEDGNKDRFLQNFADQRDTKNTLMETLLPDRNYKPPKIDAQGLMRDPTKAIKDGSNVSQKADGGMEEVQKQKALFKADFMQAKFEMTEALKTSAESMGIDSGAAVDQMMAKGEQSNLAIMANAGLMAGGGSLATAGAAAGTMKVELSKKDQQLSPKEQKALLEDTLKRLQETRKPLDSRQEANSAEKIDAEPAKDSPKQSEFAWEEMKAEDMAALMIADPEGKDQPEMEALMQAEYELEAVQRNHVYVQEHYADTVTIDKIMASAESNGTTAKLMTDAQVVTAPTIDAGDVYLAGDGVKGVTLASDTGFDSKAVETVMDWNKLDIEAVKQQLNPGMGMHA